MRIGLIAFVAIYVTALLSYREWRDVVRLTLFYTSWRSVIGAPFDACPSSHWRGPAPMIGVPFAAFFAALVAIAVGTILIGVQLVFTPRAVYYSLARAASACRGWFTQPPDYTPPHSAALAMPQPEPRSSVDAVSRIRISGSRQR